ncbi:MAG: DUF6069 family protein [Candidatus Nanopelagicales bacterium]
MTFRPWLTSKTPIAPPKSANPTWRSLLYAGVVTGAWAGLAALVVYGLGRLLGVPFLTAPREGDELRIVPWFVPLAVPFAVAVLGALASSLVLGRRHAKQVVLWAGGLIAIASIAWPALQPSGVLWSTRIWLMVMHAVAWFLIVPQIARIAGDSEPDASQARELLSEVQR